MRGSPARSCADVGYDAGTVDRVRRPAAQEGAAATIPRRSRSRTPPAWCSSSSELAAFAPKHDEAKLVRILERTWRKMSPRGRATAAGARPARLDARADREGAGARRPLDCRHDVSLDRLVGLARRFVLCLVAGAPVASAQTDDAAAIRDLFNRYKAALLSGDGATAARLVDPRPSSTSRRSRASTLNGAEDAVRQRPFVDRLLIVTMRHELPAAELEGMDLEGLLKHAIDAGWIGKQSIMGLGIGEITVNGDEATAVAITPAQAPGTDAAPPPSCAIDSCATRASGVSASGRWSSRSIR